MNQSVHNSFYQIAGGTLPLDALTYVKREADDLLYKFAGFPQNHSRVCFVLAPRQTGKSSLMVRTARALTHAGLTCAMVNLQELGEVKSEEGLYLSLLHLICEQVELPDERLVQHLDDLWAKRQELAPALKFKSFIAKIILGKKGERKLVIFVDEIQTLVKSQLQDSFIGTIKALADTQQSALQRLTFVLLGVAKPSDLSTNAGFALNLGEFIEIGRLGGDLAPLKKGLLEVIDEPERVLKYILSWTGGQPFLTQYLCHLVAKGGKIKNGSQVVGHINKLVSYKIVKNWRAQDRQSHLQEIENWFVHCQASQTREKLTALSLYREVLQQGTVDFEPGNAQWDLLISGLVVKSVRDEKEYLQVANPIYQQVFTLDWITAKEKFLKEDEDMRDPLTTIYGRSIFVLIDQSASMRKKDGGPATRWQRLEEQVYGDIDNILTADDGQGGKVCESIFQTTFNLNRWKGTSKSISTAEQVSDVFLEYQPMGNANIAPTLEQCINLWLDGREKIAAEAIRNGEGKAALFIIYIDGQFDDSLAFEELLKKTCLKIDDQSIFKVIIIGLGNEVNVKYFDELDANRRETDVKTPEGKPVYKPFFFDSNGKKCNIVVFELVEELDPSIGIIELLERQLNDPGNPANVRKGFSLSPDVFDS